MENNNLESQLQPPAPPQSAMNVPQKLPNQKTPAIIKTIAILYILTAIFAMAVALFFAALSGLGNSGGGVVTTFNQETIANLVLFCLAIIEAWGLFRRQSWARIFGIVLGVLFYIPVFFLGKEFTFQIIWNPLLGILPFPIFAIIYLAMRHVNMNWEGRGTKSLIIAVVLSLIGLGFVVMYIQTYYKLAAPVYQNEIPPVTGAATGGTVYNNTQFGFELTFPTDEAITQEGEPNDTNLTFSPKGFVARLQGANNFYVEITGVNNGQDSIDKIPSADPRDSVSQVVINNITYLKDDFWTGGSFTYSTIHNGEIFHFANYGGMKLDAFTSILQTLKFTN